MKKLSELSNIDFLQNSSKLNHELSYISDDGPFSFIDEIVKELL